MGPETIVAINLALTLMDRAAAYMATVNKAKAEGRDVSSAELDAAVAADDKARGAEQDAIARARAREKK